MLDEHLAYALDTTVHKVAELRRGLIGDMLELIYRLRPALVCLLGFDRIDEVNSAIFRAPDEDALRVAMRNWQEGLGRRADDVITTARQASSLADLRDKLGLTFSTFNEALISLGAPYTPIVYPDDHEEAFRQFIEANATAITDRLRERYASLATRGDDIRGYIEGRRREGLHPDPNWLIRYQMPPFEVMSQAVGSWLVAHGAKPDLDATTKLPPLEELRAANFGRLEKLVPALGLRVTAWCRLSGQAEPSGWLGTSVMTVKGGIESAGTADLVILGEDILVPWIAGILGWPSGMLVTLDLEALGLQAEDLVEKHPGDPSKATSRRPVPTITIGGRSLPVGTDHLAELAQVAYQSIDEGFLAQTATAKFGDLPITLKKSSPGRRGQIVVTRMPRLTDDQRSAIGLCGEVAARAWLDRRYQGVRWRSGYAAIIEGDEEASDSWGYDFEVPYRNSSLLFEVKALVDEPRDLTEFEMGESEVRAAQECAGGDRYRIILVTSVLEPENRCIYSLPSPFSRKGSRRFRVIGRGLRYQCALNGG